METPYSKAWKRYIKSKHGESALNLSSLGCREVKPGSRIYQQNRLRHAFDDGWNAAKHHYSNALTID